MLSNYLKLSMRHFRRSRLSSCINVIGLSSGIAITLLIASYCYNEWDVNRQLKHADRQCKLTSKWKTPNSYEMITYGQLAKALKDNYPHLVANYFRWDGITTNISKGDKHFREGIQICDSTLLPMYGFPLLHGDASTALSEPFTIIIPASKAIKFFGRTDVIGQTLTIENFSAGKQDFRITGVLAELPRNSVTDITDDNSNQLFVPVSNLAYFGRNMDWANPSIVNYVELQPGVQPAALDGPIRQLIRSNAPLALSSQLTVEVRPMLTYYLTGNGGRVLKLLYTLSVIALFILLMAIINFINLSIGQSVSRMREIGVRKVLGSLRRQLIQQFLTESVLLSALATALALLLYVLLAPLVASMLGKPVPALHDLPWVAWLLLPVLTLTTGIVAGIYPACKLSAMASIESLKGKLTVIDDRWHLRKGLLTFQFATAIIVLTGTVIISRQIGLFFSDRLGYNKDFVVAAQLPRDWTAQGVRHMQTLRSEMAKLPEVQDISLSYEIPNGNNGGTIGVYREGADSTTAVGTELLVTDNHYAATYGIPVSHGRFLSTVGDGTELDPARVTINEMAARSLGWQKPEAAVGQRVRLFRDSSPVTISGVVKDFFLDGMDKPILPCVFIPINRITTYRFFSFKLKPGNIGVSLERVQRKWSALMPGAPFDYKFMDETLRSMYRNELRLKKATDAAVVVALVVVLLGVAGLLSLSIGRRMKEIAIRKVIGSSVPGIIRLFIREYLPLLVISGLIASPVAYFIMHRWLRGYATRIDITPWPFVIAIGSLGIIMTMLIVLQTLKAAWANPAKYLKTE